MSDIFGIAKSGLQAYKEGLSGSAKDDGTSVNEEINYGSLSRVDEENYG